MNAILPRSLLRWLLVMLILALFPLLIHDRYLISLVILSLTYAVLAASWDLVLGYAGVFNFAHITIFAIGAYVSAIMAIRFGISPWFGFLIAGFVSATVGAIIALPALKLRSMYVGLLTYAFTGLCRLMFLGTREWTGGSSGLVQIPTYEFRGVPFYELGIVSYYCVAAFLFVLFTCFMSWLINSRFGHSIRALRDAENYAASRGISRARQHVLIFFISSFIAGVMGSFYAHYTRVVSPSFFDLAYTNNVLSIVIVGGIGTFTGSIVAAFPVLMIVEYMQNLGPIRLLIMAALMISVVLYFPKGIYTVIEYVATYGKALFEKLKTAMPLAVKKK